MKRCLVSVLLVLSLCCCRKGYYETPKQEKDPFIKAVWISYSEINSMLKSGEFKDEFLNAANSCEALCITDLFVHTRAFGDSLFPSRYYTLNPLTEPYDFDVLEYMIDTCHSKNMRFHAWINPYRTGDGSFSDPSSTAVQSNIIKGIKEILLLYKVDGIHFDDYFYPSAESAVDRQSYADYSLGTPFPLSLKEFRTANVNLLISSAYDTVKLFDESIVFSISPAASIEKNKSEFFADVNFWCENGCVDWIMPQLYFGFDYPDENYRFNNLLETWKSVKRADNVKLIIGLAAYKLGTAQKPDCDEWSEGKDILKSQTELCVLEGAVQGVCFFSFSSLFAEDRLHTESLSGIKDVLKEE